MIYLFERFGTLVKYLSTPLNISWVSTYLKVKETSRLQILFTTMCQGSLQLGKVVSCISLVELL